ncbi:MAG: hypothetical protein KBA66_08705 [Leptospiraceae bacterium]|nr:hypothetical protein [Leptospiraceae bacterium]
MKLRLNLIIKICLISFLLFGKCQSSKESNVSEKPIDPVISKETELEMKQAEESPSYNEQIACKPHDCVEINFNKYAELDDKIYDLLDKNTGRILVRMKSFNYKLDDKILVDTVEYLREVSKRDGRVSIEPYYIGQRDAPSYIPGIPIVKDVGLLGWDIYNRFRNTIKFRHTKHYNAKVLFHPKYHTIMMIYFVHKNYGDVCNTIYSNCKEIEYLDDDTFDLSLSTALKETAGTTQAVKVHFRQAKANLPDATLDMENIKKINQSSRLYKWLVITKKTEKKTTKRERFMGVEAAIGVIDYSLKLYDYIQQYKMYSPALQTRAEVIYSGEERGGEIKSVVFYHDTGNEKEKK